MTTPANRLLGTTLPTGWKVIAERTKAAAATGGHFSAGYIVEAPSGKRAFLKALDFAWVMGTPDWTRTLQAMLEAYNFERDILNHCRDERLDRVVIPIEDGEVLVEASPVGRVPYLIFELADGDVRKHMERFDSLDVAWALRTMHNVATGMLQLHHQSIAHQDLKPSNVLVFAGDTSKIGDLGCAATKGRSAPRDSLRIAGDRSYAPPELLYGFIPSEWDQRRFGCDLYLLGSMLVFMFTNVSMTALLLSHMSYDFHPTVWAGDFKAVLPHLQASFALALGDFEAAAPKDIRGELVSLVSQLCNPDPAMRGHRRNLLLRASNPRDAMSVERFVSRFDVLARRAEKGIVSRRR